MTQARAVPYRYVLRQHRAALRTALVLAALGSVLPLAATVWSGAQEARQGWTFAVGDVVSLGLPLFGGVLVAGPMVAEELASGTYKLAWTQGVTPARWLAAKLLVPVGVLLALTLPMAGVMGALRDAALPIGPAPVAYTLFAVAFGALCGLLVRRTTAAMALAGLVLGVTLMAGGSQPYDTFDAQLTLTVPLLAGTAVAAAAAFLLLHRAARGDAS
ncbi:ABC transporter permease [Streptomyces sp. NBC_00237]|uniref:hypothetical protein n=1 Tax=Streptomyces sp. NBC_00237 TaxID=2975687 RepID=UPI00224CD0A8|nr:hypothetical protein [Streptomyces sp. NBC_00237]MCX5200318.1 ABC transporter permease [Streptomyces sp. NBC_00237]